jgi:hypothetical protein
MTTATMLAINIPLMVVFLGLWTGIPLWMVLKHPDRGPRAAARTVPQAQRAYEHAYAVRRRQAAARSGWRVSPHQG